MTHDNGLLWEVTVWEFLLVTVALAGAGAYLTGRSVARSWESDAALAFYMVLLAAATRFIHYALFQGTLLSLHYYVVDLLILLILAFVGKRVTRARQMATQYSFDFDRNGPFAWTRKSS